MVLLSSVPVLSLLLLAQTPANPTKSWMQVGDPGVYTFATSPDYANDGLAWIASGAHSYEGDGNIHLVTGHGDSAQLWSTLPGGPHRTMALAVSPTFAVDSTVIATSAKNLVPFSSLWKSTSGGLTWTEMPQPAMLTWGTSFKSVVLSPTYATDQMILGSCGGVGCGTQRSDDGGVSWTLLTVPTFRMKEIAFADDFQTSGFAYGIRNTGSDAFMRSINFAASFSQCSQPLGGTGLCAALTATWGLAVAPLGPQGRRAIYYVGKPSASFPPNFLRSIDNGSTWQVAGSGLAGLQVYDVVIANNGLGTGRVYAATSGGVFISDNGGTSFSQIDAVGLPNPVTKIELAGGPSGDLYVLAGGVPDPTYYEIAVIGASQPGNLYRLQLSGTGAVDLGFALPGVAGAPSLKSKTTFGMGSNVSLELSAAAPSAPTIQVFGGTAALLPILDGILVPSTDLFVFGATSATGTAQIDLAWPANFLPGSEVFTQAWTIDAAASQGFSASNGLKLTKL